VLALRISASDPKRTSGPTLTGVSFDAKAYLDLETSPRKAPLSSILNQFPPGRGSLMPSLASKSRTFWYFS
jgi:hypothetical protein